MSKEFLLASSVVGGAIGFLIIQAYVAVPSRLPRHSRSETSVSELGTPLPLVDRIKEVGKQADRIAALSRQNDQRIELARQVLSEQNSILEEINELEEQFSEGKLAANKYLEKRALLNKRIIGK